MPHDYVLKNLIFDSSRPPKGDTWGMNQQSQPKSCSICYTTIITEYFPNFGIKILKTDFVIEFYCYLTCDPSPGPLGGGPKISVLLHTPLMLESYKPYFVGFCPTVEEKM